MTVMIETNNALTQDERKKARQDAEFCEDMRYEIERIDACKALAEIGTECALASKHRLEWAEPSKLGASTMFKVIELLVTIFSATANIDKTFTRPKNIETFKSLHRSKCDDAFDAERIILGYRSLALKILVERTGDLPDEYGMDLLLAVECDTDGLDRQLLNRDIHGSSGVLYAMSVVYSALTPMCGDVGDGNVKPYKDRVKIEPRDETNDEGFRFRVIQESSRFAARKGLAEIATRSNGAGELTPIEAFAALGYLSTIISVDSELTETHPDEASCRLFERIAYSETLQEAQGAIAECRNLSIKKIGKRYNDEARIFADHLTDRHIRSTIDNECKANSLHDQAANRAIAGMTNTHYSEVVIYAATTLMLEANGRFEARAERTPYTDTRRTA